MPEEQTKPEEAKKPKEQSEVERLRDENTRMMKMLSKLLPASQQANDGRPWEFDPRPQQVGTGGGQSFIPLLCKNFVPEKSMPRFCVRTSICLNARRVDRAIGCEGGLDGKR